MGDDSTTLTEVELRNAGASASFIAYYQTAKEMGESTAATNHAEKKVNRGVSYPGGGFFESLWNNEPRWSGDNPYGADKQNKRILQEAGVYDTHAPVP